MKLLISINGEIEYESELVDVANIGITQKFQERDVHGQLDVAGMDELILVIGIAEQQETLYPETGETVRSE